MSSSNTSTAASWIAALGLAPHPEGGHFRETYRSDEEHAGDALPYRYGGTPRAFSTSIYYLLERGQKSRLHRLASDEIWHFHAGDPVTVHLLDEAHGHRTRTVGLDAARGEAPQLHIPRGTWFGATLADEHAGDAHGYVLVGCTVSPGFDFADFEVADPSQIAADFPDEVAAVAHLIAP